MRLLNGFFHFPFVCPQLVIAMLLLSSHDEPARLSQRLSLKRSIGRPQVAIDLPNCGLLEVECSRSS